MDDELIRGTSTPPGDEEVIALIPDNVSAELNVYLGELIDEYCSIPWVISPEVFVISRRHTIKLTLF